MSDKDNTVEEFLAAYCDPETGEYIPQPGSDQVFFGAAHEHFQALEKEEAQLLGEIANMRFKG